MVRLTAVFISRPQSFVEKLMLLAHFKLYRSPILPIGAIHISPCRWIHDSVREKAEKRWEEEKLHFHTFPTQFSPFFLSLQWCLKAWLIFRRNSPRVIQYFDKLNEMMHGCHEREEKEARVDVEDLNFASFSLFSSLSPLIIITEAALRMTESMQNIDHSTFHRQTQARQDWIFDRFPMDSMDGGGVKWTSKKKFIWIDNE